MPIAAANHDATKTTSALIESRLAELEPNFKKLARRLAAGHDFIEAEDLAQEMALKAFVLLADDTFASNAFVFFCARRAAWDFIRAHHTSYRKYVGRFPTVVDMDGQAIDLSELIPDSTLAIEESAMRADTLAHLRAALTPNQQTVFDLHMAGYANVEIAAIQHTSKENISRYMACIQAAAAQL